MIRILSTIVIALSLVITLACGLITKPQRLTEEQPKEIIGGDGAPMVLIPAGEFRMGSNHDESERPIHPVYVDAFYMDRYEVTNAQYKKFIDATGYREPRFWHDPNFNPPDRPVTGVSWDDAMAYAEWAGKRLATEAEWEKAARGGLEGKKYSWGNRLSHDDANFVFTKGRDIWNRVAPVGSFEPNSYGLYDMAGNVSEWCSDWYNVDYYMESPTRNPPGPGSGEARVTRGGTWTCHPDNAGDHLRVAKRGYSTPASYPNTIGFRCAKDIEP